ncbi:MAG TPA: hypothetical protein DCS66_14085 [Flavobacteriaceae bacterium]|nr:hypothetical protein [Flavobacteriaceae bacterium]|tara:strand:- start:1262 stop:1861 length:600 start_codon:yes stop_codon:yes gene_type:complete
MNHIKLPVIFEKVLDEKFCKKVLKAGGTSLGKGQIGDNNTVDENIRKSKTKFISEEWLYQKINPFLQEANKKGDWNFNVNWYEPAQVTQYKKSDFYNWHVDEHTTPYPLNHTNKNFRNKIRKVSCSLLLSDPKSFEGGFLDLAVPTCHNGNLVYKKITVRPMGIGTLIFFPSFVAHQVNPITRGTRHALVLWALGPSYA